MPVMSCAADMIEIAATRNAVISSPRRDSRCETASPQNRPSARNSNTNSGVRK